MFTLSDMLQLIQARPFVPFRIILSDGGTVDVKTPETVAIGRRFANVVLPDPNSQHKFGDRWTTVWYMHVSRIEQLLPGQPPFGSPPESAGSPTPSPV